MNALSPALMTPRERIEETASVLAAGLVRLRLRKSSRVFADCGESSLDFPADQSGRDGVVNRTEIVR